MGTLKKKVERTPTARDLEIWEYAEEELFDYLYKGIAGWFQILGHRIIGGGQESMQVMWSLELVPGRAIMCFTVGMGMIILLAWNTALIIFRNSNSMIPPQ